MKIIKTLLLIFIVLPLTVIFSAVLIQIIFGSSALPIDVVAIIVGMISTLGGAGLIGIIMIIFTLFILFISCKFLMKRNIIDKDLDKTRL